MSEYDSAVSDYDQSASDFYPSSPEMTRSRATSPKWLRRTRIACRECKRRRIRCSDDTPCGPCTHGKYKCERPARSTGRASVVLGRQAARLRGSSSFTQVSEASEPPSRAESPEPGPSEALVHAAPEAHMQAEDEALWGMTVEDTIPEESAEDPAISIGIEPMPGRLDIRCMTRERAARMQLTCTEDTAISMAALSKISDFLSRPEEGAAIGLPAPSHPEERWWPYREGVFEGPPILNDIFRDGPKGLFFLDMPASTCLTSRDIQSIVHEALTSAGEVDARVETPHDHSLVKTKE